MEKSLWLSSQRITVTFFTSGDTRALALSLFSEIATVFLTQDTVAETGKIDTKQLNTIIGEKLFPQ